MAKRFENALFIQRGACNPSGVALALAEACKECLDEGVSQRHDPAVRLIGHQLAFLLGTRDIDDSPTLYSDLFAACEKKIEEPAPTLETAAQAQMTAFDWSKFSLLVAKAVGEQPDAWQFEISGLAVDGSTTPIVRCPTLANGVRVAHEFAAISGKPCVVKHPDLGSIMPSDPPLTSDEAANNWIDAAIVKQECKRLFNCRPLHLEPDWTCFTGLEIDGRAADPKRTGVAIGDLDDETAEYWVVQGRDFQGDAEDIADCRSLADAIRTAQDLANMSGLVCAHSRLGPLEPGEPAMTQEAAEDWIAARRAGRENDGPSI